MKWLFRVSIFIILVAVIIIIFVPQKTNNEEQYKKIDALKNLSELATTEFWITKIVQFEDNNFFGSKKILFETSATIKAGVKLDLIQDNDIQVKNDSVTIILPPPQLLSLNMNPDSIKEVFVKADVFRGNFSNKDKDVILTKGEISIRKSMDEIGIYEVAKNNTKIFMKSWLTMAGFQHVNIIYKNEKPFYQSIKKDTLNP